METGLALTVIIRPQFELQNIDLKTCFCMYVCTHTHTHTHIYIYIYIYTHVYTHYLVKLICEQYTTCETHT